MVWIILVSCILILMYFLNKNTANPIEDQTIEIKVPNPENSNPKRVIEFIDTNIPSTVKQVYTQLNDLNKEIDPALRQAFETKIARGFIQKEHYLWKLSLKEYDLIQDEIIKYSKSYIFEIKGLQKANFRKSIENCILYEELILKPEPNNKFDKNAIRVKSTSGFIGYVPAIETIEVKNIIKNSHKTYLESVTELGGYIDASAIIYYA